MLSNRLLLRPPAPLPQLLPLHRHLPLHLGWDNPKLGSQHLPREVFRDSAEERGSIRCPLAPAACWGGEFEMPTALSLGILPSPALLGEKHPGLRQILGRGCPHTTMAALITSP